MAGRTRMVKKLRKVLVVEDDAWIRKFLRDLLSDEGYQVLEAADGHTGLRLAGLHRPDIMLLDLAMPEYTGVDLLRDLRHDTRTRRIPVVVLSAYPDVLPAKDAENLAAVLAKPLNVTAVLTAVKNTLDT